MTPNAYTFAHVKMLIDSQEDDIMGEERFLALIQPYRVFGLDVYGISLALKGSLKEGDFVLVDTEKREVVNIIRNSTKARIETLYKDVIDKEIERQTTKPPQF